MTKSFQIKLTAAYTYLSMYTLFWFSFHLFGDKGNMFYGLFLGIMSIAIIPIFTITVPLTAIFWNKFDKGKNTFGKNLLIQYLASLLASLLTILVGFVTGEIFFIFYVTLPFFAFSFFNLTFQKIIIKSKRSDIFWLLPVTIFIGIILQIMTSNEKALFDTSYFKLFMSSFGVLIFYIFIYYIFSKLKSFLSHR